MTAVWCCGSTVDEEKEISLIDERHAVLDEGAVLTKAEATYPAAALGSFVVSLQKTPGVASTGLVLDPSDGDTLHICALYDNSIVGAYNREAPPGKALQVGDVFLSVNRVSGTSERLTEELVMSSEVEMRVCRPEVRTMTVDKKGGSLGLKLNYAKRGRSLCIDKISDGAIKEWNDANPGEEVKEKDRIIAVNQLEGGPEELLKELGSAKVAELRISRFTR
mmetsp:Transcript_31049/g.82246  ORF Transcript_31049/g.82246 Transcript_31049/m.82246 type:complete len:221 (+) Transcript_31049:51-713(+)